jgi:long-chain acyl-CoA synthetase
VCLRGPSVFRSYFKDPVATREAFDADGFFMTGDVGFVDAEGFLHITDRKKDLLVTAGGKNVAPQPVENALKATGYISQAALIGDQRRFVSALIALDPDEISNWARDKGIKVTDRAALSADPRVNDFIASIVAKVNETLPRYEQIKKFRIIPNEFTIGAGEITPTQKVKRRVVLEHYRKLVDEMYV